MLDKTGEKMLVIVGPTATGKTSLALQLAETYNGDIISADSRQVFKGMDIGTGKDIPESAKYKATDIVWNKERLGYYKAGSVRIWGYDLVTPKEEFNVAEYLQCVDLIVDRINEERKLPIFVGGTGLYIKAVIDGIETAAIPRNRLLRAYLEEKSTEELYELLANTDSLKAASLNASDRYNPRRLVRAIEVAQWNLNEGGDSLVSAKKAKKDTLTIGLKADREYLYEKVIKRVAERINLGLEDEIRKLIAAQIDWDFQSMDTLGYKEWKGYFQGKMTKEEVVGEWIKDEKHYIKRQLTWFKKDKRIKWFDVSIENWKASVENTVNKWYKKIVEDKK